MLEYSLSLFDFNLAYLKLQAQDIPGDTFPLAAFPGGKSAQWLLGHLALSNDFALQLLNQPTLCPDEWRTRFGPGSDPDRLTKGSEKHGPETVRPGLAELLAMIEKGAGVIKQAARVVPPERLAERHHVPMKQLLRWVPTVGELLAHLMSTHFATHLGQLSVWRRQHGLPEVF